MAKIQKGRPLPSHTKLDYDECYAKVILEKFFPEKYVDLQIADKPDLRDTPNNIGIEVTSAIPQNEQEALSLACKIPYLEKQEQNKRIAYLKGKGYSYSEYVMAHPGRGYAWVGLEYPDIKDTWCNDFLLAVETKMKKLNNGGYAPMAQYDLFVNSELFIDDWMPDELLKVLIKYSQQDVCYSFIYLLALNGLFVFDLKKQKVLLVETDGKLYGLGVLARKMVEEGEEDGQTRRTYSGALPEWG